MIHFPAVLQHVHRLETEFVRSQPKDVRQHCVQYHLVVEEQEPVHVLVVLVEKKMSRRNLLSLDCLLPAIAKKTIIITRARIYI